MNNKIIYICLLSFLVLFFSGCKFNFDPANRTINSPELINTNQPINENLNASTSKTINLNSKKNTNSTNTVVSPTKPSSLVYQVPFTSQAPFSVWDELHEEACEEASMIMVNAYFKHQSLNSHLAEQQILDLVKWEEQNNYGIDISAQQVVTILKDFFSVPSKLVTQVTVEEIKDILNSGRLVIVPAAGRDLGNPNFTGEGPIYHMLVIKGYDSKNFITNDPGTRKGESYRYLYQTLIGAIHDWPGNLADDGVSQPEMETGVKAIIAVGP